MCVATMELKTLEKTKTFISRVIADGRVTIPMELRKDQGIKEGDFVELQITRIINASKEA